MGHENIWLRLEEQPPERPRHMIQYPKMLGLSPARAIGARSLDLWASCCEVHDGQLTAADLQIKL
jgi:hypothetical protein